MTNRKIERLTKESIRVSNRKMGQLVETIEGAETIKPVAARGICCPKWLI